MSWGFFAELKLTLSESAWNDLKLKRPSEVSLAPGWSGLSEPELENAFSLQYADESFEVYLQSELFRGEAGRLKLTQKSGTVALRALTLLNNSELEAAQPLAALLVAAAGVAESGELRLVNDGTYVGENGSLIKLAKGKLTASRIKSETAGEKFVEEILKPEAPPAKQTKGEVPPVPELIEHSRFAEPAKKAWSLVHQAEPDDVLRAYGYALRRASLPTVETASAIKKSIVEYDRFDYSLLFRLALELDRDQAGKWLRLALTQAPRDNQDDLTLMAIDYVWAPEECLALLQSPPPLLFESVGTHKSIWDYWHYAQSFGARQDLEAEVFERQIGVSLQAWEDAPQTDRSALLQWQWVCWVAWGALLLKDEESQSEYLRDTELRLKTIVPKRAEDFDWMRRSLDYERSEENRVKLLERIWAILNEANDAALMSAYAQAAQATKDLFKVKTAPAVRRKVLPARYGIDLAAIEMMLRMAYALDVTRAAPLVDAAPALWKGELTGEAVAAFRAELG